MSEDIDKRVLRKYEIREKLGKGVRHASEPRPILAWSPYEGLIESAKSDSRSIKESMLS